MADKSKDVKRFAATVHNKENRYLSQNKTVKITGINKQRAKNANENNTKTTAPAVDKNGERTNDVKNANESSSVQQKDLKLQVAKWRAERQARLAAKILKKPGKTEVPSAVLGISASSFSIDITGNILNSSLHPKGNKDTESQRYVKSTVKTKSKPIEVRQTTASRLRMEKVNPLLTIAKCTGLTSTYKLKTPASSLVKSTNSSRKPVASATAAPKQLFKVPKYNERKMNKNLNTEKECSTKMRQKTAVETVKKTPSAFTPVNRIKNISVIESGVSKLPQSTKRNKTQLSAGDRPGVSKLNQRTRLRRSASATAFRSQVSSLQVNSVRSPSEPDISRASTINQSQAHKSSAAKQSRHEDCLVASATPHFPSVRKSRMTLFATPQMKTPLKDASFTPQPDVLRKNLISWLEKRGKSLNSFGHLRCFGLHKPAHHNPTEVSNIKEVAPATHTLKEKEESQTAEPSSKVPAAQELKEKLGDCVDVLDNCNVDDLQNILSDLHKLILASYPRDQCEEWLYLIRKKFPNLDREPLYWECLAALEEARGDYSMAIDFYSRAIVSGAEAEVIDKSLDLLWEKFTSLKLHSVDEERDNKKQKTPRRSVDPRQVFKSSIIKFALQQKAIKELSTDLGVEPKALHYVATPVRRSTRKSNNPYKSSSVVCVSSLNTLQPDVRDSVVFVSNNALTPKI